MIGFDEMSDLGSGSIEAAAARPEDEAHPEARAQPKTAGTGPAHLVFDLYAMLASHGDAPGNERRNTAASPRRSQVLGLVAAALGYARDDNRAHFRLAEGLFVAVATLRPGRRLQDYHSVRSANVAGETRADALEAVLRHNARPITTLTTRDYIAGGAWRAALTPGEATLAPSLEAIAEALRRPHYPLYLGRRAYPLDAPPDPRIIRAASPIEALLHDDRQRHETIIGRLGGCEGLPARQQRWLRAEASAQCRGQIVRIEAEAACPGVDAGGADLVRYVCDDPGRRSVRAFHQREEAVFERPHDRFQGPGGAGKEEGKREGDPHGRA